MNIYELSVKNMKCGEKKLAKFTFFLELCYLVNSQFNNTKSIITNKSDCFFAAVVTQ